jgi:hypothetical protein
MFKFLLFLLWLETLVIDDNDSVEDGIDEKAVKLFFKTCSECKLGLMQN